MAYISGSEIVGEARQRSQSVDAVVGPFARHWRNSAENHAVQLRPKRIAEEGTGANHELLHDRYALYYIVQFNTHMSQSLN